MANPILICTATLLEMEAWLKKSGAQGSDAPGAGAQRAGAEFGQLAIIGEWPWAREWSFQGRNFILAITGVGIPLTLARLIPLCKSHLPGLILNLGIAGAYPGSGLEIGDLILGESECFGDLGVENSGSEGFIPLTTMPWADEIYRQPLPLLTEPWLTRGLGMNQRLSLARGCTVNTCTGTEESGIRRRKLFAVDFESMEGASVALVGCLQGIPVGEIRAISNMASIRDMRPENISLALENLSLYMEEWLGLNS